MNITLGDFFPKYPDVRDSTNPLLNPYTEPFNQSIYNKREFNELKLARFEDRPAQGELYKHQTIISRFFSSHTPYTGLLLLHEMGTGKTCSLFGATEQIKKEGVYRRAYILTRNPRLLKTLRTELAYVCTKNIYSPDEPSLTELETQHRIRKLTDVFYSFITFDSMKKELSGGGMTDERIIEKYSNCIFGIDEVHNLKLYGDGKNSSSDDYNQIHRLLHVAKNIKVLLLSGTPMTDHPNEIAQMMNLILPLDEQLPTGKYFTEQFLYEKDGINYVKEESKKILKSAMKGRVSYLKTMMSDVSVGYAGEVYEGLQLFKVVAAVMSRFQTETYKISLAKDVASGAKDDEQSDDEDDVVEKSVRTAGVYSNSRQSTLFVFPDGSYGSAGFKKYIVKKERKSTISKGTKTISYVLSEDLKHALQGKTTDETLNNIRKCSTTYADTIESILKNRDKLHFVYGKLIEGSGNILFGCLLSLVGYSRGDTGSNQKKLTYFNVTKKIYSEDQMKTILKYYSSVANKTGALANVLISSKILSEGFTLKNIQQIHVLTPHWNFSELAQAIARGIRLNAHVDLAGQNPEIQIYLHVAIPNDGTKSLDLDKYIISERKDVAMKDVERLIKEAAVDCALFLDRNRIANNMENSRECEYQKCAYTCDGISSYMNEDVDYTTYNLYYSDNDVDAVIKKLVVFFGAHFSAYIEDIIAMYAEEFQPFIVMRAISTIINKNYEIYNRYNIISYVREDNNVVYLIDNISIANVFSQCSYTKFLAVKNSMTYNEALNDLCIGEICTAQDIDKYLENLSFTVKQYLCETVMGADLNDMAHKVKAYFKITANTYTINGDLYSLGGVKVDKEKTPPQPKRTIIEAAHGYSGKYSGDNFCIVKSKLGVTDAREKPTGRICTSWLVPQLCKIAVELDLPYGNSNTAYAGIKQMPRDALLEAFKDTKIRKVIGEFSMLSDDNLRRVLYFASARKEVCCAAIRKHFGETGLLIEDGMCGKTGVKRKDD